MLDSSAAIVQQEIYQQPATWLTTLERVIQHDFQSIVKLPAIISGAGTSAYASLAIAASWPGAQAIPSTDLLIDAASHFPDHGLLVSVARSGNSPESLAVVESLQRDQPRLHQLAITCNEDGRLARALGIEKIILDPRTNDRSLAMTSSFTNIVLAGLCLNHENEISLALPAICQNVEASLPRLDKQAEEIARSAPARIAFLASRNLYAAACEAALKVLEMTAGETTTIAETFLGLRHGPMAFLRPDTMVVCFMSSDPRYLRYESDLIAELRHKGLGRIIGIAPRYTPGNLFDDLVPANAPHLSDYLRTPFEIVFPQLLAYHLSLKAGLNPDSPSPGGVINRVVQGVSIYET